MKQSRHLDNLIQIAVSNEIISLFFVICLAVGGNEHTYTYVCSKRPGYYDIRKNKVALIEKVEGTVNWNK